MPHSPVAVGDPVVVTAGLHRNRIGQVIEVRHMHDHLLIVVRVEGVELPQIYLSCDVMMVAVQK